MINFLKRLFNIDDWKLIESEWITYQKQYSYMSPIIFKLSYFNIYYSECRDKYEIRILGFIPENYQQTDIYKRMLLKIENFKLKE